MQTSYPMFESGQVLTATHLNDLVDYLEQQERLTRNKVIGIGIICGLKVGFEAANTGIRIDAGCAITSQGYLLVHQATLYTHFRIYSEPVAHFEEAPEELQDDGPYPFFQDANDDQINLWEALPVGFIANPGEPAPAALNAAFLQDKVALLFLERNLEALRNCDINDCSDKGAEWDFTLRVLLVSKTNAQTMLETEEGFAQRPVDLRNHPRYDLKALRVEKINPAAFQLKSFEDLVNRISDIGSTQAQEILDALNQSYVAFKYLLADGYSAMPNGPFGDGDFFVRLASQWPQNFFLAQYLYAYLLDIVAAYNEFLAAAMCLDAECCPNEERFPLHVLLGETVARPIATTADPSQPNFDPLNANSGFGATSRPAAFRHHFIHSPLFDRQGDRLKEVRSLHYRLYLLSLRYSLDGLLDREIRLTPSKTGDVTLSEQAIPYYYALLANRQNDDLARNWAYRKTTRNWLDQLYSYTYTNSNDHPLRYRLDDHNFYRVEGTVGKALGDVMATLIKQKRELGLSFAIEPVYIGFSVGDDLTLIQGEQQALQLAQQALLKLLVCRMRDLDVVFLTLMAMLFQYIMAIIAILASLNTRQLAGVLRQPGGGDAPNNFVLSDLSLTFSPKRAQVLRRTGEALLKEVRLQPYVKGAVTRKLTTVKDPKSSVGQLYEQVKDPSSTANLFDRTQEFVRELGVEDVDTATQRLYAAVSLLDKSEELVTSARAASLAEFDFASFEKRYDGFVQATEAYLTLAQKAPDDTPAPIRQAHQAIAKNYSAIATSTPQAVLAGLADALRERMSKIFAELMLGAYAQRHPGMEHRGGVPVGGTLVLLYTHRSFAADAVHTHQQTFEARSNTLRAKMVAGANPVAMNDPRDVLRARQSETSPLNEFVVLADFCLPYLCCDSDCSDIDLEPGPEPEPPPPPPPPPPTRTVVVAMPGGFDRLDPGVTTFSSIVNIAMQMTDPLVWLNEAGEIVPHLATEWEGNDDFSAWTFRLREGVFFHDGTPFTAEAVKFTFDRIFDPATGSQLARNHLGPYRGTEALDDLTVTVMFERPYVPFLEHLSGPTLAPICPQAVNQAGQNWGVTEFTGTGPFKLESVEVDSAITLVANPDYQWGQPALGQEGPPQLEKLVYRFIPDGSERTASLEAGESHFEEAVPPSDFGSLGANPELETRQFSQPGSGWGLVFNHKQGLTGEIRIRQAMQVAMDRDGMVEEVYKGLARSACSPLTFVTPCFADELCERFPGPDLERAKEILAQEGWRDIDGDGILERQRRTGNERLSLTYFFRSRAPLAAEMAEFLRRNFAKVGIEIILQGLNDTQYFQAVRSGKHNLQSWCEPAINPDVVRILLHSNNANGGTNRSNFEDREMDERIAQAAEQSDPANRCEIYLGIQFQVKESAVMEFWCDPEMLYAHSNQLSEVTYYHKGLIPYFYTAKFE